VFLIFFHNACERILSDVCKNKITMSFQKNLFTWRFKKISAWCSKKLFCWCCYVLKKFWVMTWCFLEKIMMWRFSFLRGGWRTFFRFTLKAFISIRVTLGIIQNDYFDHVRHVWDILIYSEPSDYWNLFFENAFSKTSVWKWIKIRFLAYYDFAKAITTFLTLETKNLDAYGQSIWQL